MNHVQLRNEQQPARQPRDPEQRDRAGDQTADPNNGIPYTDGSRAAGPTATTSMVSGAVFAADTYLDTFPYLATPLPGSPN